MSKKCSIMIVDDNEVDRYLLKRLIKKSKIEGKIFEAKNGKEALNFFSDYLENKEKFQELFPPIILFLDINMPIMGGFEFLEEFRKLREKVDDYQAVVFAMFSSSQREEDIQKAESYDFVQGFVTKGSLSVEGLIATVKKSYPNVTFASDEEK